MRKRLIYLKCLTTITFVFVVNAIAAAPLTSKVYESISVIPLPQEIIELDSEFEINSGTTLSASSGLENELDFLSLALQPATGFSLPQVKTGGNIALVLDKSLKLPESGYLLNVDHQGVQIVADTQAGVFYGIQTLLQLLPAEIYASVKQDAKWKVPGVSIKDYARFQWRGMHLDVARHFKPVAFIKKFLKAMAAHKMNSFHWHLTEDQGWRIEIKKYPKLTSIGSVRKETLIGHLLNDKPKEFDGIPHKGFYTQEDIKDIVTYAQQLHINIVPEIEMPGHAQAALAAYPEYGSNGQEYSVWTQWGVSKAVFSPEEKTISFLKDILVEVMALFPSKYIHVGGDEAQKDHWENSERVQLLARERGLADMHEMQSWFVSEMASFLQENNRRLIGWDEILEGGIADNAVVMSWRGDEGGIAAAKMGHDVVMAAHTNTYFDYYQSQDKGSEPLTIGGFLPLEKVYAYNPVPEQLKKEQQKHVLGAQAQLWSEYMPTEKHVEYMAFPRLTALSEVLWLNDEKKNLDDFVNRLSYHFHRLAVMGISFRPDESSPKEQDNGQKVALKEKL